MTDAQELTPPTDSRRGAALDRISKSRFLVMLLGLLLVATSGAPAEPGVDRSLPGAALGSPHAGMPEPEAWAIPTGADLAAAKSFQSTAITLGDATIRLRAGRYTLHRFNSDGSPLRRKAISLSTARSYPATADPQLIGDRPYTKLTGGAYQGWLIATPDAAPAAATMFPQPVDVALQAGTHVGLRFHSNMRIRLRLSATLPAAATYRASRQAVLGDKTYLYLTNGPLATRWIALGSAVKQLAQPVLQATPSEPPVDWKVLVLVYRDTDVTFKRADGSDYRLRARMTDAMYDLSLSTVRRTAGTVGDWSGRLAGWAMDVVDVPHPIDSLAPLGSGYWVGPQSVRADLNQYAPAGTYDSIFVIWQSRDSSGVAIPVGGWGLSLPPGTWSNGAGFSSVITPAEMWWWTNGAYPEEVFIHEWMHQVLYFHEAAGRLKLDLHAASQYGYQKLDGTYRLWLSDVMQGKVRDGDRYLGVSKELWRAGTPSKAVAER